MKKRILLLTKSDKNKGYCLAGIDLDTNKFVRLVGDKNGAEIKKEKCKLLNNTEIEPLDVLNIDIIEQCPLLLQPENCLLSENNIFEKIEKYSIDDLQKLLNKIHCDNILSTTNEYFNEKEIKDNKNSINIILVINICIYDKNNTYGQTKTKCSFKYNNQEYKDFSITCSNFYHKIIKMKKAILVISLPPNPSSNQRYYKIVAQIFSLDD